MWYCAREKKNKNKNKNITKRECRAFEDQRLLAEIRISRAIRSSAQYRHYPVVDKHRGSRCGYYGALEHHGSQAGSHRHRMRRGCSYRHSMGSHRSSQLRGEQRTCDFPPTRRNGWLRSKQRMHWRDRGGCHRCGCSQPLGRPPARRWVQQSRQSRAEYHPNIERCLRWVLRRGDNRGRFLPTWPGHPFHWRGWWTPCARQRWFPSRGSRRIGRPWGEQRLQYREGWGRCLG